MNTIVTNLKIIAVVAGTLALYTWVANAIPQVESEVPEELTFAGDFTVEDLVTAGEQLFQGPAGCVACHGLGTRAPVLLSDEGGTGPIGERCATRVPGQSCKEYLHESLVEPGAFVVEGYQDIMPDASRTLSETQIWALVAYLQSLGGEVTVTTEEVAAASGDGLAAHAEEEPRGGPAAPGAGPGGSTDPMQIWQQFACGACHQLDGQGGPIGPPLDDIGAQRSAEHIRESILFPNADTTPGYEAVAGTMPPNFGDQMSAAQLEALVSFLAGRR